MQMKKRRALFLKPLSHKIYRFYIYRINAGESSRFSIVLFRLILRLPKGEQKPIEDLGPQGLSKG